MAIDPNNLAATAHLTFSDEFDDLSIRHNHAGSGTWNTTHDYAPDGYSAGTTWFVSADNPSTSGVRPWTVDDGVLNITAQAAPDGLREPYTSGHLDTQGTFSQTYGYFEMSAKMPATGTIADGGNGSGAGGGAFWLLPTSGAWPPELDVFESNSWGGVFTAHTGVGGHSADSTWLEIPDLSTSFHRYGVAWEPDKITWYLDGQQVYQAATPADMHDPMYLLLNLYTNDGGGSGPSTMEVDYVRVYAEGAGDGITDPSVTSSSTSTNATAESAAAAEASATQGSIEAADAVEAADAEASVSVEADADVSADANGGSGAVDGSAATTETASATSGEESLVADASASPVQGANAAVDPAPDLVAAPDLAPAPDLAGDSRPGHHGWWHQGGSDAARWGGIDFSQLLDHGARAGSFSTSKMGSDFQSHAAAANDAFTPMDHIDLSSVFGAMQSHDQAFQDHHHWWG